MLPKGVLPRGVGLVSPAIVFPFETPAAGTSVLSAAVWSGLAAEWFSIATMAVGTPVSEQLAAAASLLTTYSTTPVLSCMEQLSFILSKAFYPLALGIIMPTFSTIL